MSCPSDLSSYFGLNGSSTSKALSSYTCSELNNATTGLTFAQRQTIQAVRTLKTGQTTSYRTGDDGYYQFGRGAGFSTLTCNNPFGNTNRFTDTLGGQTYSDDIVVDWLTGLMWYRVPTSGTWNQAIDGAEAATTGGYTDWFLPNFRQLVLITNLELLKMTNYSPFNINIAGASTRIWSLKQILKQLQRLTH